MRVYGETLTSALDALTAGSTTLGAKSAVDLPQGLFMLHVARRRRKGRHVIVFRVQRGSDGQQSKSFVSFMTPWISPGILLRHDSHKRKYSRLPLPSRSREALASRANNRRGTT